MKIDWKHLCRTPGYLSLKKAVVENVARKHRDKKKKQHIKCFIQQLIVLNIMPIN